MFFLESNIIYPLFCVNACNIISIMLQANFFTTEEWWNELKMDNNYNGESDILLFLGALAFAFVVIIALWINNIVPFLEKRKYIKMEMERSTDDDRYRYWKKRLKQLYLHSMPVIGRFFK